MEFSHDQTTSPNSCGLRLMELPTFLGGEETAPHWFNLRKRIDSVLSAFVSLILIQKGGVDLKVIESFKHL